MTTWTQLFPDEAVLLGRRFFKEPGIYNATVPALTNFVRAHAVGSGGQGSNWGGGGAYARSVVPVQPGDNLVIQVGDVSTATTVNDSFVKRNNGSVICYADRGRGIGTRGSASLSIGDITRDGSPGSDPTGVGGAPGGDLTDYATAGFGGRGTDYTQTFAPDYGGGGHRTVQTDGFGNFIGYTAWVAGTGLVCLEWFDSNPHY